MARYAELHAHTNFSFLSGASHPHELVVRAAELGYTALAVTDHDGFYGVVRFAEAAREVADALTSFAGLWDDEVVKYTPGPMSALAQIGIWWFAAHLVQLEESAAFRSNLGLVNLESSTTSVEVEFFAANGAPVGTRSWS